MKVPPLLPHSGIQYSQLHFYMECVAFYPNIFISLITRKTSSAVLNKFTTGTLIMLVQIQPPIIGAWSHSKVLSREYEVTVLGVHSQACSPYTVANALSTRPSSAGLGCRLFLSRPCPKQQSKSTSSLRLKLPIRKKAAPGTHTMAIPGE